MPMICENEKNVSKDTWNHRKRDTCQECKPWCYNSEHGGNS